MNRAHFTYQYYSSCPYIQGHSYSYNHSQHLCNFLHCCMVHQHIHRYLKRNLKYIIYFEIGLRFRMPLDPGWVTKLLHNLFLTHVHRLVITPARKSRLHMTSIKICSITGTHPILDRFDSKARTLSTVNKAMAS